MRLDKRTLHNLRYKALPQNWVRDQIPPVGCLETGCSCNGVSLPGLVSPCSEPGVRPPGHSQRFLGQGPRVEVHVSCGGPFVCDTLTRRVYPVWTLE